MTSVEQLILEHEELDAIAVQLEEQVRQAEPSLAVVLALRARLSVDLNNHLSGEDAALYPKLAASSNCGLAGAADSFQSELATLKADWMAYLEEWCGDAIASDWTNFAQETLAMMARLRARIARENTCLIPAALQRSMVSLRAAA
jgi:hemerythrin-like domain-containing protein